MAINIAPDEGGNYVFLGRKGTKVALALDASNKLLLRDENGNTVASLGNTVTVRVPVAATAGANAKVAVRNPYDAPALVEKVILNSTTASGNTNVFDLGTAADAATSSDNLIDGASLNAVAVYDNVGSVGTNGKSVQKIGAGEYVTGSSTATTASYVGVVHVTFRKA